MASRPNPVSTWSEYFASMLDKPLHPIFRQIDSWLPSQGKALELGAGVGHGVVHLVELGLNVTAIDAEPEAVRIIRERAPSANVIESRFEDVEIPVETYDVVIAGFSFFFLNQVEFSDFWPRLLRSMKPGCVFAAEFLGLKDNWVKQGYLGHEYAEVRCLLQPFEILYWEEAERDGKTSQGSDKHWHVYHVVARLKST